MPQLREHRLPTNPTSWMPLLPRNRAILDGGMKEINTLWDILVCNKENQPPTLKNRHWRQIKPRVQALVEQMTFMMGGRPRLAQNRWNNLECLFEEMDRLWNIHIYDLEVDFDNYSEDIRNWLKLDTLIYKLLCSLEHCVNQ